LDLQLQRGSPLHRSSKELFIAESPRNCAHSLPRQRAIAEKLKQPLGWLHLSFARDLPQN
jgi:hypothetical protein